MSRREEILAIAAELFAQKGFHGVSIAELGAACGFSGPALYRHFRSKDAVLAEMLVSISDELLTVGRERVRAADSPEEALQALIDWHVTFALDHKALIVVQDRDWSALPLEAREKVRETQRKYVEVWVKQLRTIRPDLTPKEARAGVHAAFGLLNSTPHSAFLPTGGDAVTAVVDGGQGPGSHMELGVRAGAVTWPRGIGCVRRGSAADASGDEPHAQKQLADSREGADADGVVGDQPGPEAVHEVAEPGQRHQHGDGPRDQPRGVRQAAGEHEMDAEQGERGLPHGVEVGETGRARSRVPERRVLPRRPRGDRPPPEAG